MELVVSFEYLISSRDNILVMQVTYFKRKKEKKSL